MRSAVDLPQPDGPEQHEELAVRDLEREVAHRDDVAEPLGDVVERDPGHPSSLRGSPGPEYRPWPPHKGPKVPTSDSRDLRPGRKGRFGVPPGPRRVRR